MPGGHGCVPQHGCVPGERVPGQDLRLGAMGGCPSMGGAGCVGGPGGHRGVGRRTYCVQVGAYEKGLRWGQPEGDQQVTKLSSSSVSISPWDNSRSSLNTSATNSSYGDVL